MCRFELRVITKGGRELGSFKLDEESDVTHLKSCFHEKHEKFSLDQQAFSIGEGRARVRLTSGRLKDYGLTNGSVVTFKDLGQRVDWSIVGVFQNLLPLLFHFLFVNFPTVYNTDEIPPKSYAQTMAYYLICFHFAKHIFEHLAVHQFNRDRLGVRAAMTQIVQSGLFAGLAIAYYLYHPLYTAGFTNSLYINVVCGLFLLCEMGSLQAHYTLRSLKKGPQDSQHYLPQGGLFQWVSCPHYMFESLCWLLFSILSSCLTAYVYFAWITWQLLILASKRHRQYKRLFRNYSRKISPMFPFVPAIGREGKRPTPAGPSRGVVFPKDGKGLRSTTAVSKNLFVTAFRSVEEYKSADDVAAESNWRFKYVKHFMRLVEAQAKSPENALKISRTALNFAHDQFEFVSESGECMSLKEAMATIKGSFETGVIRGSKARAKELEVPYNGRVLKGASLRKQLDLWEQKGVMEADAAGALKACSQRAEWLDLSNHFFVLIGAGSAMGPYAKLLEHGANVIAIDIPKREQLWQKLIKTAENSAGTLYFPLSKPQDEIKDDQELYQAAGCNLLQQPAEILNWLLELCDGPARDRPIAIGNYTYLDAALHVLLSVSADAIIQGLCEQNPKAVVAFLCTPTDIHVIPSDANRDAKKRHGWHFGKPIELLMHLLSGGKLLRPNALRPIDSPSGFLHRVNGLSIAQGPNYALAKRLQHFRAIVAYEGGHLVSSNIAPSTATLSVVHNRQFAWAYAGFPYFDPMEVFQQETTNSLMAGLLVHDIQNREGPKNPENRLRFGIDNALSLFSKQGLHGGLWRCAYQIDSLGVPAVLVHFLGGPKLFLVVVYSLALMPAVLYRLLA